MTTPTLLTTGRMEPGTVVGSVDTSEFLAALAANVGFRVARRSRVMTFNVVADLLLERPRRCGAAHTPSRRLAALGGQAAA